jgi:hypothetical protein
LTKSAPTRAEPDRLRVVEEKLDRLLKKFDDAAARIAPTPVSMTAGVAGATTDRDPKATAPIGLDRQGRATTEPVPYATPAELPPHRLPYSYGAAGDKGLEQRVATLEDRLAKVDRILTELVAAIRGKASTPEGRTRAKDDPRTDVPQKKRGNDRGIRLPPCRNCRKAWPCPAWSSPRTARRFGRLKRGRG